MMFNLPNVLTVSNLFFGCCAIVSISQDKPTQCILFVLIAAIVDFMDGFIARKLNQESALGAQLDSLSDVVTFGVVPGMICFQILQSLQTGMLLLPYIGFALALTAAFRLARFNVSSSGKDIFFTGLPVPANALFFCGLLQLNQTDHVLKNIVFIPVVFVAIVLLFSYLMISHWKILKIHLNREWLNKYAILLIAEIITLTSAIWIGMAALSLVVLIHIVFSLFFYFSKTKNLTP
jgi:CDP-diacylglycerol--serine O-phosphatidyltransferase